METEFSVELTWVKAKTGLRHFPYPGEIALAGLAWVKLRLGKNFTSGWF
jgi:hypothetical protein